MKILAPINEMSEIKPLVQAGADEFYCGLKLGDMFFGSRKHDKCVFGDLAELKKASELVKSFNKKIYLTVNSPIIRNSREIKLAMKLVDKLKEFKVDAVIVSNPELVKVFKSYGLEVIASSLFGASNPEDIKFLQSFGIKRIILDRQIEPVDISSLGKKFPDIEFEVFGMYGACKGLELFCNYLIAVKDNYYQKKEFDNLNFPHLCFNNFSIDKGQASLNNEQKEIIIRRLNLTPHYSCGACAIFKFKKYKIDYLKIVGRGSPLEHKLRNVRFLKAAIQLAENTRNETLFKQKARRMFKNFLKTDCQQKHCYYPHF